MNPTSDLRAEHERIHADPRFGELVRKRRKLTLYLLVLSMMMFFFMPAATSYFPGLLSIKLLGPVNVGLAYIIGQYFVGAAIAWYYVVRLRAVDVLSEDIISEHTKARPLSKSCALPQGANT